MTDIFEPCYLLARSGNREFEKLTFANFSSKLLNSIIWLLFPILIMVLVPVLKLNPVVAEWWTQSFARAYSSFVSIFTRWFPISLTEVFFISLAVIVVIAVIGLIKLFVRKKWISAISKILSLGLVATSIISTYDLSCEFAYNRSKLPLPYYTEQVDNSEFKDIYNFYASDLNYCISQIAFDNSGDVKRDINVYGLSKLVNDAYTVLDNNPYFFKNTTVAKPMMTSLIYRELQITGFTFNPFAEANIDVLATNLELPLTVAHELAHTKGVMREDDSNQVAFYVCLNSDNPYLRFSAYGLYFYQLTLMTSSTYMEEADRKSLVSVNASYYKCRNYAYEFWKKHDLLGKIGDWLNNLYIKGSGVDEGTDSYQGGTDSHPEPDPVDPEIQRLVSSKYQQLFFERYYRLKGEN